MSHELAVCFQPNGLGSRGTGCEATAPVARHCVEGEVDAPVEARQVAKQGPQRMIPKHRHAQCPIVGDGVRGDLEAVAADRHDALCAVAKSRSGEGGASPGASVHCTEQVGSAWSR